MSMISELVEKLRRYARFSKANTPSWSEAMTQAADTIEALSEKCRTIDDEPVRHGRWENTDNNCYMRCSKCGKLFIDDHDDWLYCPNCGAKMDGESEVQYENTTK